MYIVDGDNEVVNRVKTVSRKPGSELGKDIVAGMIAKLDEHNSMCMYFRRIRDRYKEENIQELEVRLVDQKEKGKQYELPTFKEVTDLIVENLTAYNYQRDIIVQFQSNELQQIRDDHPLLMSLQYPLLCPYGEHGFHTEIQHAVTHKGEHIRTSISICEYYAYQIESRLNECWTLVKPSRLLHQYIGNKNVSDRDNQEQIRSDLCSNLYDAVGRGESDGVKIGKQIVLPSSFIDGPRYMVEKYQDAMAICKTFGNPNLFTMMTANPNWKEINELMSIYGGSFGNERPEIDYRIFKMKLNELVKDLEQGTFLYRSIAGLHTIEFQKRGLPHAHILLWLEKTPRIPTPSEINATISAELPNKTEDPVGFHLVGKHMMHGPCGKDRP